MLSIIKFFFLHILYRMKFCSDILYFKIYINVQLFSESKSFNKEAYAKTKLLKINESL